MPELPEVEVVRLGLAPAVDGATVTAVEVRDARALTRHPGPAEDFAERLSGAVLAAPARRGKFLWVPIAGREEALLIHLGMSGQVLLHPPSIRETQERSVVEPLPRHLRVRIRMLLPAFLEGGIDFVDQRTFGSLALDPLVGGIPAQVGHIARDVLDPDFDPDDVVAALRRKRTTVKRALLDQTLASGIGNIYADEALWAAQVHPDQPTETLSRPRARALLAEVRAVMLRALGEGGTSFDAQYVNVNGQSGYFDRSLNAYARDGEPCPRCGTRLVKAPFANRHSHFCPRCQRIR